MLSHNALFIHVKKVSGFIQHLYCSTSHSRQSGMDHTVLPANHLHDTWLSPDDATTDWGGKHLIAAYYSYNDPERMKGWVGLVGWPIADGLPNKWSSVSCRSSAGQEKFAGQIHRRITAEPRNQRSINSCSQWENCYLAGFVSIFCVCYGKLGKMAQL